MTHPVTGDRLFDEPEPAAPAEQPPPSEYDARPFIPLTHSLDTLAVASLGCRGCPLYETGTQTVFGRGPDTAGIVLVGEQPGDVEDHKGTPFVGPAGAVLWQCVEAAGLDRESLYVTNAVKHFKHEMRGKRRLHKTPDTDEVNACHPWLEAELDSLRAAVVVALGATAARSLMGKTMPIAQSRGETFHVDSRPVIITYHPSAVLRADDRADEIRAALIDDLRRAASFLGPD